MYRLLTVLLLGLTSTSGAQALPPAPAVRRVADSLARAFVADRDEPSVAVAMVRGKDTLILKGYGLAGATTWPSDSPGRSASPTPATA